MPSEGVFYVYLIAIVTLTAMLTARLWPYYRTLLINNVADRFPALDGLRGVLAVSVFIYHASCYVGYFDGNGWDPPPHQTFLFMAGAASVAVFFMITGFLFWSKAIAASGKLAPWPLYVSRIRRIYPMLMLLLAANLIIMIVTSGGFREPPYVVLGEVLRWLLGGLAGFPVVNASYPAYHVAVTWTLQYEAWFYLLLPLLALLLWKPWRFVAALGMAAALLPFTSEYVNYPNLAGFALGAIAAYCIAGQQQIPVGPTALSFGVGLMVAALCWSAYHLPTFSWRFIAFPIFLAVLYGCTFFGVLTTKAWRLLGTISYSIYLMHGTVLYIVLGTMNRVSPISAWSTSELALVLGGCAVAVVGLSCVTYRLVERPFMRHGVSPSKEPVQDAALRGA